ncbi:hypothetical protein [Schumannella sp. 10F1B-5-1]|uniref:hypothetical protein n=1 Tax=Schumannella sp. 10F1B-5-1 TaxID=2590780 RepID=UPI001131C592|nr:hypothetical protein [Schumannella sp. 10F1B-5-1]TPW76826.1 hypothetical protein FJ658_02485 [Schumannella sp. 10F1B-5-1]
MSPILRIWLGFAALGAGLIHLALVIGAPPGLAVAFALLGAAEFAWGTFCFARDEPPLQRLALLFVLLPLVGWIVVLLAASALHSTDVTAALRPLPLVIATLLDTVVAVGLALRMRGRRRAEESGASEPEVEPAADEHPAAPASLASTARFLLGVGAGALVIAALTTTGLSATEAGSFPSVHELNLPGLHLH